MPAFAIEAVELSKTYGKGAKAVHALTGLSFAVEPGTVFGLLGPNGAGKSTTVRILTTLSRPDAGEARVHGIDVVKQPEQVRQLIGYVSQKPGFDPVATGLENLVLQGRIHGASARDARSRAAELLERFGLTAPGRRLTGTWSGGMQRKLDVAMGLMHRPRVLFLDEPTTGLDPEARRELWDEIARLAIVEAGRVVAAGTPDELKSSLGGDTIRAGLTRQSDVDRARAVFSAFPGVGAVVAEGGALQARVTDGASLLPSVLSALAAAGVELTSVGVARPSLDDVYLHHAGRSFGEADRQAVLV